MLYRFVALCHAVLEVKVRLADWVISCSLEINNGCLRYLAESQARGSLPVCAEPEDVGIDTQAIYTETLLARDSRRILSHWQLIASALEEDEALSAHISVLKAAVSQLTDDPAPLRLAMRLAGQAPEEAQAQLMLKLGRSLPVHQGPQWTALNELFARDSALWRDASLFMDVRDEVLRRRIGRSYRSAYKLHERFPEGDWADSDAARVLRTKSVRGDLDLMAQYTQLAAHHMELLRHGLSDKQKHQLWYMDKLANAFRMRRGLRTLIAATRDGLMPKKAAKQARKYLVGQEDKVNKRISRLFEGAFVVKSKKYARQLGSAIDAMGLETVGTVSVRRDRVAEVSLDEAERIAETDSAEADSAETDSAETDSAVTGRPVMDGTEAQRL